MCEYYTEMNQIRTTLNEKFHITSTNCYNKSSITNALEVASAITEEQEPNSVFLNLVIGLEPLSTATKLQGASYDSEMDVPLYHRFKDGC